VTVTVLCCLFVGLPLTLADSGDSLLRRRLDQDDGADNSAAMQYNLPASASEWCSPPLLPPLPYEECKNRQIINSVPLYGGLTNSLKMVLLGAILSFEEGVCFFVDESQSELLHRGDKSESLDSFINRYFEPIGLSAKDPRVKRATKNNKIEVKDWTKVWENVEKRRMYGQTYNIESLGYPNIEGHHLKRVMLRRMWRPLPKWRHQTCNALAEHVKGDEFMTFSVRRGDKSTEENFSFATMQQYVDMADQVIPSHFNGKIPTIFVATDDCSVMQELRGLRPHWKFVSECDRQQAPGHDGFALADMKAWSQADTDAHYAKFFVELYAMASSRVFIGVWYTNVSWVSLSQI